MCIYVFVYGIVKIEIYSYNKEVSILYTVVMFPSYIPPKQAKTSEPKDEHCVLCTYTSNNIHDPIPLDKLKNHTALLYITPDSQSAYRKNYSTETSFIKITNDILWGFENQKFTLIVILDLLAVFDTVDCNVLLTIL